MKEICKCCNGKGYIDVCDECHGTGTVGIMEGNAFISRRCSKGCIGPILKL